MKHNLFDEEVLVQIISHYLETNKRLVIPQLGAFIVKVPGESVVFSEFLKRDDGILRGLLTAEGLGELEAAGAVDRFIFELRHAVQAGREYHLKGFGVMHSGENGTIVFDYMPSHDELIAADAPAAEACPAEKSELHRDPKISTSAKMNPAPYVKGLRYGKPVKTTTPYTYVDSTGRKKIDKFLLLAIVAAVIAVVAIAYGYMRETEELPVSEVVEQTDSLSTTIPEPADEIK